MKKEIQLAGIKISEIPKPVKTFMNITQIKYKDTERGIKLIWDDKLLGDVMDTPDKDNLNYHTFAIYQKGGTSFIDMTLTPEATTIITVFFVFFTFFILFALLSSEYIILYSSPHIHNQIHN